MIKKNKLHYRNFNICQLVDKGKLKLQYLDEFKEYKKIYHKNKTEERQESNLKQDNFKMNNFEVNSEKLCSIDFIENLLKVDIIEKIPYSVLKYDCNFITIKFNKTNEIRYYLSTYIETKIFIREIDYCEVLEIEKVEPYLLEFDMLKKEYTTTELKELLSKYIETKKVNNKKLIK